MSTYQVMQRVRCTPLEMGCRRKTNGLFAVAAAVLVLACQSAGPTPSAASPPISLGTAATTPTTTPTSPPPATSHPRPTDASHPKLGPIPADCPPGSLGSGGPPHVGASFGGSPVWGTGLQLVGGQLVAGIPDYFTYDPQLGWSWKIVWNIDPGWHAPISLRIASRSAPATFESHNGERTTDPILDPSQPDRSPPGGWAEFGSYVWIPVADCYSIDASWPDGGWTVWFAAGAAH